ncbi:MAG: LacI family transcriptional regulator [Microbacterium sp.]|jgi:ribose transport system substrate-binding protein|nr:LacI family transcriptional regulator [Microbacterium sp.]
MFKKRIAAAIVGLAAFTLALSGCSGSAGAGAGSGEAGGADGAKVAYLTVSQTCEYCARQAEAFTDAMEEAGAELTVSTTDFDAAEQAQQINQAISTNPDLIVVWPTDNTSIIPALQRIKQAGIPVLVTTYLPATDDTSLWTAWVGPDDKGLGEQAAEALVAGLDAAGIEPSGSVVEVTGVPGGGSTIDRGEGFAKKLAEIAPDITIVGSQPGNWDQTQATTAAAQLFSQYGGDDLIGLFGQADNMVAGAIVAAEQAGYQPGQDLVMVGSDCTIEGYTNIENGKQFGTNLQDPVVDGDTIAETAIALLNGEDVENITYIDTPSITLENLSECAPAVGK